MSVFNVNNPFTFFLFIVELMKTLLFAGVQGLKILLEKTAGNSLMAKQEN